MGSEDIDKSINDLWGKYSRGQSAEKIRIDILSDGKITPISFRPFDDRWTYYSGNSCGWIFWPREKATMGHLLNEPTTPIGANIDEKKLQALTKYLHREVEPIDVFNYVYAILHDPAYYEKYNDYLCRDFPRVPIINVPEDERAEDEFYVSEELFEEYVEAGSRLHKLLVFRKKYGNIR